MNISQLIKPLKAIINPIILIDQNDRIILSSDKSSLKKSPNLYDKSILRLKQMLKNKDAVYLSNSNNIAGIKFSSNQILIIGPIKLEDKNIDFKINAVNSFLKTYEFINKELINENTPYDQRELVDFIKSMETYDLDHNLDILKAMPTEIPHNSYSYELKHLEAVTQGDPQKALRALRAPMNGQEGKMGFTKLRHHQNSIIINATLDARAAIKGGVRVESAYTLADFFILKAEACKDVQSAILLREQCTYRFAQLVKQSKMQEVENYSLLVNKLLEEIQRSIFLDVKREDIVKCVNKNVDYAQRLFKKDVGHSIMEHLRYKRIQVAKEILATSDIKISDLCSLLHFSSTSHFARVFRFYEGQSPLEYKEKAHLKVLI